MKDAYPLERALQIIDSLNLNVLSPEEAIGVAKKLAAKALARYNQPVPKIKSQLLEDIQHATQIQSSD